MEELLEFFKEIFQQFYQAFLLIPMPIIKTKTHSY